MLEQNFIFFFALFWWLFVVVKLNSNWLAISLSERRSQAL